MLCVIIQYTSLDEYLCAADAGDALNDCYGEVMDCNNDNELPWCSMIPHSW